MTWQITRYIKNPQLRNPILVEGLPGIGNVGKVAVDFMIDNLKAKRLCRFFSYSMPHSVFVNEDDLVDLPTIEMYYKQFNDGRNDLLLLTGDVQPIDETSSYEFSDEVLNIIQEMNAKELITLGGIGLPQAPKKPRVYCTGNSKKIIARYKKNSTLCDEVYGVVGPIVGVSGILLGLAKRRDMEAISLLAETMGHPMYLGIKGAKEILRVLHSKLTIDLNLKQLDKEIKEIESELGKGSDNLASVPKRSSLRRLTGKFGKEVNYIG
ncbi:MAG: PAC2 family protein [archaeon]